MDNDVASGFGGRGGYRLRRSKTQREPQRLAAERHTELSVISMSSPVQASSSVEKAGF